MKKSFSQFKFLYIILFCLSAFALEAQVKPIKKKKNFRLSVDMQLYGPSPVRYDFPIASVDSFSVTGSRGTLTYQFGITAEIIDPTTEKWALVFSIGAGQNNIGHRFEASADFTKDGQPISSGLSGGPTSFYLLPSIGLSYRHTIGRKLSLQHSLLTTLHIPLFKDEATFARWESSDIPDLSSFDFSNAILVENSFFGSATNKVLGGLEYRPEILLGLNRRFFWAIGFVLNYSIGTLVQGDLIVKNEQTSYEGTFTQGFSKIGISARFGLN